MILVLNYVLWIYTLGCQQKISTRWKFRIPKPRILDLPLTIGILLHWEQRKSTSLQSFKLCYGHRVNSVYLFASFKLVKPFKLIDVLLNHANHIVFLWYKVKWQENLGIINEPATNILTWFIGDMLGNNDTWIFTIVKTRLNSDFLPTFNEREIRGYLTFVTVFRLQTEWKKERKEIKKIEIWHQFYTRSQLVQVKTDNKVQNGSSSTMEILNKKILTCVVTCIEWNVALI